MLNALNGHTVHPDFDGSVELGIYAPRGALQPADRHYLDTVASVQESRR